MSQRVTRELQGAIDCGHAKAVKHPQNADEGERSKAHHHHADDALRFDEATVEEGDTGGHQQHQSGGGDSPG